VGIVIEWMSDALCATTAPDAFFPEGNESAAIAKAICARCPVKQKCLDYAVATRENEGVWGGLTPPERRKLWISNPVPVGRLTPPRAADWGDVLSAYRAGASVLDISEKFEVSPQSVYRIIQGSGRAA
jgi:WhiB family redox-sensing transcriptional regulator